MGTLENIGKKMAVFGIAALCLGYFIAYIPYSMMTKMVTRGMLSGMNGSGLGGFEIQPVAVFAGLVAMYAFITAKGWWKHATQWKFLGLSLPRPRWYTFISGLCTSSQIITTTLAYTFSGISIVFAMLLMKGGVLAMAPIVDAVATKRKRKIYWPSWVAAALSMAALLVTFTGQGGTAMTVACTVDVVVYLLGYFVRLYFMSNFAKSDDVNEKIGYFTEEQTMAMPALMVAMFIIGLFGIGDGRATAAGQLWYGFTEFLGAGYVTFTAILGIFSTCTGLFGTLIYLDQRENTFTVPANRAASVVAGLIATYFLAIFYGQSYPDVNQLLGVALILAAIFFLAYRAAVEKRKRAPKPAPAAITLQPVTETE
jgi:uncharacterized membrane protein YdcZ (DUF606 family)